MGEIAATKKILFLIILFLFRTFPVNCHCFFEKTNKQHIGVFIWNDKLVSEERQNVLYLTWKAQKDIFEQSAFQHICQLERFITIIVILLFQWSLPGSGCTAFIFRNALSFCQKFKQSLTVCIYLLKCTILLSKQLVCNLMSSATPSASHRGGFCQTCGTNQRLRGAVKLARHKRP